VPQPAEALKMARIVKPGGVVVVVDFMRHSQWMREELKCLAASR
jgi:ubiquinone/menaquinone biosynthesis C-methylase UbiE